MNYANQLGLPCWEIFNRDSEKIVTTGLWRLGDSDMTVNVIYMINNGIWDRLGY